MQQMTAIEALDITIGNLNQIRVPVGMMQDVGIPIGQAVGNLAEIRRALVAAQEAQEEKEKEAQEAGKQEKEETEEPGGTEAPAAESKAKHSGKHCKDIMEAKYAKEQVYTRGEDGKWKDPEPLFPGAGGNGGVESLSDEKMKAGKLFPEDEEPW